MAIYDQETREFEFKPGAIFANIVVADEINRASPKTQSALLECMEERQVTVDGVSYELARPFLVMATQNPLEMEGTYPLPEAQRDRFTARVSMGYPGREAELAMLDDRADRRPARRRCAPVADAATVRDLVAAVGGLHVVRGGPPLRRRPRRGLPPLAAPAAGRLPAGRACSCCAPPAPRPPCSAATTCCPTTSRRSPRRCWRTGCCSPPTPPWAGAAPSRSSPSCSSSVPVPRGR